MQKYYQIVDIVDESYNAGSKAVLDIQIAAFKHGFKKLYIQHQNRFGKIGRQLLFCIQWIKIFLNVEKNSIVLTQHPFHDRQLFRSIILKLLKKWKKVSFIALIHDVEELRKIGYNNYYKKEFELMSELVERFIVHNIAMRDWFIAKGFPKEQLIILDIFDYLHSVEYQLPTFSREIIIAGNLAIQKSPYIYKLNQLEEVSFNLMGVGYSELKKAININYRGSFPPDELPVQLNSGFGLVWDGDSLTTCSGATGNYLRYNNPHKLSLYLSAGLPVIVWSESAEANFVIKNQVGFVVSSLFELRDKLNKITVEEYNLYVKNVHKISNKLVSGEYTKKAIQEALLELKVQ